MEFNLSQVMRAVAAAVPEACAIVQGTRRLTFDQLVRRADQLAGVLGPAGLGSHRERADLEGWESGQDHLALYLHNGAEYLEGMLGAHAARMAPFNVNYRYVAEELRYLLTDSRARAIVYHSTFAPVLAEVRADLPDLQVLLQVRDDSGHDLLPDGQWYEDAVAAVPATPPVVEPSPDDLYIVYTGGTTGMPKGVLWRHGDISFAALAAAVGTVEPITDAGPSSTHLPEDAAWFSRARPSCTAGAVGHAHRLRQRRPRRAAHRLEASTAHVPGHSSSGSAASLLIVGDAFGRPLPTRSIATTTTSRRGLAISSGGTVLSAPVKAGQLDRTSRHVHHRQPRCVRDRHPASQFTGAGAPVSTGFPRAPATLRVRGPHRPPRTGPVEFGRLAEHGRVPLGYLGDEASRRATFPVIHGVR